MRPNGLDGLRAMQAALAETLTPELQSIFAQDAAGVVQMLAESLASEWDSAAEDYVRDNEAMEALLREAAVRLKPDPQDGSLQSNERLRTLVKECDGVLSSQAGEGNPRQALTLSSLAARNNELRAVLERTIVELEDVAEDPRYAPLLPARAAIYRHLRQVSLRGWSFWDVASFRERVVAARKEMDEGTGN